MKLQHMPCVTHSGETMSIMLAHLRHQMPFVALYPRNMAHMALWVGCWKWLQLRVGCACCAATQAETNKQPIHINLYIIPNSIITLIFLVPRPLSLVPPTSASLPDTSVRCGMGISRSLPYRLCGWERPGPRCSRTIRRLPCRTGCR